MIFKLVHKLQDDLITTVGPNGTYSDNVVENVYIDPPKTPTDNIFIGIQEATKVDGNYEIGHNLGTDFTYSIDLVIGVNHSDKFVAKELLETIEKRILKSFQTSGLGSVSETIDSMSEQVLDYKLIGSNYLPNLYPDNNLIHHMTMTLNIRTQLNL